MTTQGLKAWIIESISQEIVFLVDFTGNGSSDCGWGSGWQGPGPVDVRG